MKDSRIKTNSWVSKLGPSIYIKKLFKLNHRIRDFRENIMEGDLMIERGILGKMSWKELHFDF